MTTDTRVTQLAALHVVLEQQYAQHAERLAELTARTCSGDDPDPTTTAALLTGCRQTLADLTGALRHLTEGRYGDCDRCGQPIPIERLHARPQSSRCVPCQQRT